MNNHELQALRKILMLDVSEAAQYVGKVSARTWQYWESGRNKVPQDVVESIRNLIQEREELLKKMVLPCKEYTETHKLIIKYYHYFDLFLSENENVTELNWRIHQSVASAIFFKYQDCVELT